MSKNIKSISNPKLKLEILTSEEVKKIHEATLWIIEHVGIRFPSQRALEIWRSSGRTMSEWLSQPLRPILPGWRFATISLEPGDRSVLHERIGRRYRDMMAAGLLDEVKALHERSDLHPGLPSIRCVGYRQLWDYLDGRVTREEAIERAIAATRQLAKRQITWLRAMPERTIIDCLSEHAAHQVVAQFRRSLG